ncbi:DUF3617 family protein [Alkalilimnicola ehrlichii]|uniref:DUF3617 domain-containing protein n=1 Tax=Alkalilimnicola ehrlichii TaxID=351052 RepID=UPI0015F25409|nr:DUF3617 family protein [Alkalilimnicola ehrlichii]
MALRKFVLLALLTPLVAGADQVNVVPGQWEFENTTRIQGDETFPDQVFTDSVCVTEEDLQGERIFMTDVEGCQVGDLAVSRDRMDGFMVCSEAGVDVHMSVAMRFHGETMEGTIESEMDTPIGPMQMSTALVGQRVGACP